MIIELFCSFLLMNKQMNKKTKQNKKRLKRAPADKQTNKQKQRRDLHLLTVLHKFFFCFEFVRISKAK